MKNHYSMTQTEKRLFISVIRAQTNVIDTAKSRDSVSFPQLSVALLNFKRHDSHFDLK